jgi:transcriptional regulator, MucR family
VNDRLDITVSIVSAYVSNNSVRAADLGALIEMIYGTLGALSPMPVQEKDEEPQAPAVPIKKSITPDLLICLEDGKKFRSLKRHLGTVYNMTPDQYRAKWGLPREYPMVAPAYSAVRSQLAKDIGLGRPLKSAAKVVVEPPTVSAPATPAPPKKPRAKRS